MLENVMESPPSVMLTTNKRYFVEEKFLLIDCFYDLKVSRSCPFYAIFSQQHVPSNWYAIYCNHNLLMCLENEAVA